MNELSRECVSHLPKTTAPLRVLESRTTGPPWPDKRQSLGDATAIELGLGIWGENKEEILRPAVALFTYQLPSSSYAYIEAVSYL